MPTVHQLLSKALAEPEDAQIVREGAQHCYVDHRGELSVMASRRGCLHPRVRELRLETHISYDAGKMLDALRELVAYGVISSSVLLAPDAPIAVSPAPAPESTPGWFLSRGAN